MLIGSLFVFGGILFLSWNYLLRMRGEVFEEMKISMMGPVTPAENVVDELPVDTRTPEEIYDEESYTIDYSKYYGVLEIPKVWLKRGFYNVGSRYNDIQYNVTMAEGSIMPSEGYGNLVLMAHSGDSYISFFAYLYRLNVGDDCYITHNGMAYHYQITRIYNVDKIGTMLMNFNTDIRTLTLVTCTKDNDTLQTVYVAEYVG